MATVKVINSKGNLKDIYDYLMQREKTTGRLCSGASREKMEMTKALWDKSDGRQYKHYIQSFHPDEKVTAEQAHKLACTWAEENFAGYDYFVATHIDKEHIHTHIIVNSVSYVDGHKYHESAKDLANLKKASDTLCELYGLSITEKGKDFYGEPRKSLTAYSAYEYDQQKSKGCFGSYIDRIKVTVESSLRNCCTKEELAEELLTKWDVEMDWQDNHKYITFTDLIRKRDGEKKCKIRNNKLSEQYNVDWSKEGLERILGDNEQRRATQRAEQEQGRKWMEFFDQWDDSIFDDLDEVLDNEKNLESESAEPEEEIIDEESTNNKGR